MTMELEDTRDSLVLAALPHAAFDGWSDAALAEAARDLGLDAGTPARVFPGGPVEAVEHLVDYADRAMLRDLAAQDLGAMRVGERVFTALRVRLERWSPHREAIRRALSLLAMPYNLPLALRLTWRTADAVWAALGDLSHDLSWYTKRSSLAAVYSATVLYWLDDSSEGCADTWAFLRRRLADVQRIPKARVRVEGVADRLFGRRGLR